MQHLYTNSTIFTYNYSNIRWSDELGIYILGISQNRYLALKMFLKYMVSECENNCSWMTVLLQVMLIAVKSNRLLFTVNQFKLVYDID